MAAHPTIDVVVIGAGIAGLAAAYELSRRGASFVVLEQSARPGGVVLTEQIDGFTIDAGPDALLVQKPAAIDLCRELGLAERLVQTQMPRTAFIMRAGRLHPLAESSVLGIPSSLHSLAATGLFSIAGKARMAAELLIPRRPPGAPEESIGSFVRRRFGGEAVSYLAEPLLAGIHAGDVHRLSVRALFPRLIEVEQQHGSLIRGFRRQRSSSPDGSAFVSLPGGLGELVTRLVLRLPEQVRYRTIARSIEPGAGYTIRSEGGGTWRARAVIVCVPAYAVASLVERIDPELSGHCRSIVHTSSVTVVLSYRREAVAHPLGGSGFLVPRLEGRRILAATWVSSKWPRRAPPGQVLLRAFLGGARDPFVLERDDRSLVGIAEEELVEILGIHGKPGLTRVYRWPSANAQHEVGHLDRMAAIDERLRRWPGLFLTGSSFRGTGIPDCVADARATAAAAAAFCAAGAATRDGASL